MENKITTAFFLFVLVGGLLILPDFGLTWDESIQREHGIVAWDYVNDYLDLGYDSERPWIDNQNYEYRHYGVLFQMTAWVLEGKLGITQTRHQYLLRHHMSFLWFWLALIFFYKTLRIYFPSRWWALAGTAVLVLSPRIFGHAFFNPKDTVLLSGVIIACYTLVRFIRHKNFKYALLHALTCAIVVNIRIVGLLIPAVTALFLVFEVLQNIIKHKDNFSWKNFGVTSATWLLVFSFLTVLFWPYLWESPLKNLAEAFRVMSAYPWKGDLLLYGNSYHSMDLPFFYIPAWIAATTPLLWTIFGLGGLVLIFQKTFSHLTQKGLLYSDTKGMMEILAFGLFVGPLFLVAFKGSVLYNGWRQMYFVYPSFVFAAVLAMQFLYQKIIRSHRRLFYQGFIFFIFSIQTGVIANFMYQYHPWYHLYFSFAAGKDRTERFEMDYWGATYKQALERIAKVDNRPEKIKIAVSHYPGEMNYKFLVGRLKNRFEFVYKMPEADYNLTAIIGPYHHNGYKTGKSPHDLPVLFDLSVEGDLVLRVFKVK